MKHAKIVMAALAAGMLLSCAGPEAVETPERVYVYRDAASEWDRPSFTLFEDGTFSFYYAAFSSYFGHGTYTLDGERLILSTDDGWYEYRFTAEGDTYVFDAESSSAVLYADLPDGAVFE